MGHGFKAACQTKRALCWAQRTHSDIALHMQSKRLTHALWPRPVRVCQLCDCQVSDPPIHNRLDATSCLVRLQTKREGVKNGRPKKHQSSPIVDIFAYSYCPSYRTSKTTPHTMGDKSSARGIVSKPPANGRGRLFRKEATETSYHANIRNLMGLFF